jgi:Glycosyl hydrolase family 63 C-terminal domain
MAGTGLQRFGPPGSGSAAPRREEEVPSMSHAAAPHGPWRRGLRRVILPVVLVAFVAGVAGLALTRGNGATGVAADPTQGLPAWNALDTRWGSYLSEREWGSPRQAIGGDGWGMDYLLAGRVATTYGEDGIAGLTTRDGAFDIGWAVWDGHEVLVTERLFGLSNSAGEHGETILDKRTFAENTPTTSYDRYLLAYPKTTSRYRVTFESARADNRSGVLRATAQNTAAGAGTLDLVLKGWFHDPTLRVELISDGLLLHGATSVVAIVGTPATGSQVSGSRRALDANLRAGGLTGSGPGNIGALDYRLPLAGSATDTVRLAWAEAPDAATAQARARGLLGGADRILAFRKAEADGLFRSAVTDHQDVYQQALMGLLWNQSLYTWDGASSYDPAWAGKVNAHDVLIMPDKWEFNWLASWDTGFQSVAASLIDPGLGADQLRFLLGPRWQQPDGHVPCAEWVMGTECPPIFAWAARRVADAGAGPAFLAQVYPGLQKLYAYWWANELVDPAGLFTGGFLGMDNLPRGNHQAQADASAWMAFFARDLAAIATELGDTASAAKYAADADRIAAAVNASLWDETNGFYFDRGDDGRLIPTVSYTGLIPLIAGIVPADRLQRVLATLSDPARLFGPAGIRSVSARSVLYQPGYATAPGVNSNWLGPVWIPINYLLVEALRPVDAALASTLRARVVATVEQDWRTTGHFHEYFDGDTGEGLGADAQTGWTALVANLVAEGWPAAGAPPVASNPASVAAPSASPAVP